MQSITQAFDTVRTNGKRCRKICCKDWLQLRRVASHMVTIKTFRPLQREDELQVSIPGHTGRILCTGLVTCALLVDGWLPRTADSRRDIIGQGPAATNVEVVHAVVLRLGAQESLGSWTAAPETIRVIQEIGRVCRWRCQQPYEAADVAAEGELIGPGLPPVPFSVPTTAAGVRDAGFMALAFRIDAGLVNASVA